MLKDIKLRRLAKMVYTYTEKKLENNSTQSEELALKKLVSQEKTLRRIFNTRSKRSKGFIESTIKFYIEKIVKKNLKQIKANIIYLMKLIKILKSIIIQNFINKIPLFPQYTHFIEKNLLKQKFYYKLITTP